MRKFFVLLATIVILTICGSAMAASPVWKDGVVTQPFLNATLTNSSLVPSVGLATFAPTIDERIFAAFPLPATACSNGAIKDLQLNIASESAYAHSTQKQTGNSSYVDMQAAFQYNWKVFSSSGAVTSWSSPDLKAYWNGTADKEDISSGEVINIPLRGTITALEPGDTVFFYVSQNATDSGDNSTMVFLPVSLTYKYQECR